MKWHYISVFRGKWSSGSLKKRFLDTVKRSLIVFSASGKRHRFTNKYTSRYKSISWRLELSKSTWGEQPVEDILIFACISLYLFLYVLMYVTPPDQTKNDTDPQFGTHTPIDHIKNGCLKANRWKKISNPYEKRPEGKRRNIWQQAWKNKKSKNKKV